MATAHQDTVLTTKKKTYAERGAWLSSDRAALLMQSSGISNIVNMLSLLASCASLAYAGNDAREWASSTLANPMGKATRKLSKSWA